MMNTPLIDSVKTSEIPAQPHEPESEKPVPHFRKITVIANPVSGINRAALNTIREYIAKLTDSMFEICLTHESGDATRFAREAAQYGTDLVVAYGGDGTMMEVADGLRDTETPMGILPGGTANVMAVELGIPLDLIQALDLIFHAPHELRAVDMGCVDNRHFLLRAGIGYEAEATATTARGEKSRQGRLAYFSHALRKLRFVRPTRYVITADGVPHVAYGITCMICNSTSIGVPNLHLAPSTGVSDGLLDVIVIRDLKPGSLMRIVASIVQSVLPHPPEVSTPIDHWQARQVTIEMNNRQLVSMDGETFKRTKRVTSYIVPNAVRIVVPKTQVAA